MNIGLSIKQLRKVKGLTQIKLAEKVSITRQALSQIEKGMTNPSLKTIMKLLEALNHRLEITPND